jgi:F420-dependent oxidoreductase-like protein
VEQLDVPTFDADNHLPTQGGTAMKLSMQLNYTGSFKEATDQVVAYEKAGLDIVWVAEAYSFDAVSSMGYLAAKTSTVQIGSGILPLYTRTPTLLGMTAAGIDALSDGRCILGLGASGPQVIEGFHGLPYDKPLGRTREIIDICRDVWKRERIEHDGASYHIPLPEGQGTGLGKPLKLINHPVRSSIPIYVASLGPKNVEMTAEKADGWLPLFYVPEKADSVWGDDLRAGAAKRDAGLGPLDVCAGGLLSIGEGAEQVREFQRPMTALYIGGMGAKGKNFYNDLVCRYGFEAEAAEIQDLYLSGKKDEAAAKVPDALLEGTTLCGPEGYVKERLAAYKESGVTALNVAPIGPDPVKLIEQVKTWIEEL